MGFILSAAILLGAMWVVARHDADFNFVKVILIALGISILNVVLSIGLSSVIGIPGVFVALAITLGVLVFALYRFCYVSIAQAALISGIWFGALVALQIVLGMMAG